MKQKFYSVKEIKKHNAQYNLVYGGRSTGKSFAIKVDAITEAYEKGEKFIYLRRYDLETKQTKAEQYFADAPVEAITRGEYNVITVYRSNIYLGKLEDGKVLKGMQIGRVIALSQAEHIKSEAYPDYKTIIFEEVLARNGYLENEPSLLQDVVSTILRRRDGRVWLIGNTISRICPYFQEWQLRGIPKQQAGTIDDYFFKTSQLDEDGEPITIKIAVEYTADGGSNSKMFFGKREKAIANGAWETEELPHLPKSRSEYKQIYSILIEDMGFKFIAELLMDQETHSPFVFVYPKTRVYALPKRKITSEFSTDKNVTTYFRADIIPETMMLDCLRKEKLCFSDNLTGSDFLQIIDKFKKQM